MTPQDLGSDPKPEDAPTPPPALASDPAAVPVASDTPTNAPPDDPYFLHTPPPALHATAQRHMFTIGSRKILLKEVVQLRPYFNPDMWDAVTNRYGWWCYNNIKPGRRTVPKDRLRKKVKSIIAIYHQKKAAATAASARTVITTATATASSSSSSTLVHPAAHASATPQPSATELSASASATASATIQDPHSATPASSLLSTDGSVPPVSSPSPGTPTRSNSLSNGALGSPDLQSGENDDLAYDAETIDLIEKVVQQYTLAADLATARRLGKVRLKVVASLPPSAASAAASQDSPSAMAPPPASLASAVSSKHSSSASASASAETNGTSLSAKSAGSHSSSSDGRAGSADSGSSSGSSSSSSSSNLGAADAANNATAPSSKRRRLDADHSPNGTASRRRQQHQQQPPRASPESTARPAMTPPQPHPSIAELLSSEDPKTAPPLQQSGTATPSVSASASVNPQEQNPALNFDILGSASADPNSPAAAAAAAAAAVAAASSASSSTTTTTTTTTTTNMSNVGVDPAVAAAAAVAAVTQDPLQPATASVVAPQKDGTALFPGVNATANASVNGGPAVTAAAAAAAAATVPPTPVAVPTPVATPAPPTPAPAMSAEAMLAAFRGMMEESNRAHAASMREFGQAFGRAVGESMGLALTAKLDRVLARLPPRAGPAAEGDESSDEDVADTRID